MFGKEEEEEEDQRNIRGLGREISRGLIEIEVD